MPHLRGDQRPLVQLRSCRGEDNYWNELPARLDDVKDDVIQMLELRLAFERRKTEIAKRQINRLKKNLDSNAAEANNSTMEDFHEALEEELTASRLVNFANDTDRIFADAWHDHYSRPQDLSRILSDRLAKIQIPPPLLRSSVPHFQQADPPTKKEGTLGLQGQGAVLGEPFSRSCSTTRAKIFDSLGYHWDHVNVYQRGKHESISKSIPQIIFRRHSNHFSKIG